MRIHTPALLLRPRRGKKKLTRRRCLAQRGIFFNLKKILTRRRCRCCLKPASRSMRMQHGGAFSLKKKKSLRFVCPEIGADGWRCRCFFPRHAVRHIEAPVFVLQVFFFLRAGPLLYNSCGHALLCGEKKI